MLDIKAAGVVLRIAGIGLLISCLAAQAPKSKSAQRICVVAVHDSSLFTLCPANVIRSRSNQPVVVTGGRAAPMELPDGRVVLPRYGAPSILLPGYSIPTDRPVLDRAHPDWEALAHTERGICRSGWVDAEAQKRLEKEFLKKKEYALAEAPESADLVFLVEEWTMKGLAIMNGARVTNAVMAAVGVVVPSDAYVSNPADAESLINARLWSGIVMLAPGQRTIALEDLAGQFVKKRKWPGDAPPLCSAWNLPETSVGTSGYPSARPYLKGNTSPTRASADRSEKSPADANAIRVDVALVSVPVIASDLNGSYVPDLRRSDFRLFENDMEQPIDRVIPESEPFHVALILDVSNSTTFKHADIQTAALGFLEDLRPEDSVMVLSFGSYVFLDSEFTSDRRKLSDAILGTRILGGTRLYDAVDLAVTERLDYIQGRKAIVLFTDGVDTLSRIATLSSTLSRMEESDVLVYVIQYDTRKDINGMMINPADAYARASQYLRSLSGNSGGRLFNASTVPSLTDAFAQIAGELRHQYTICYYPTGNVADGSFRSIRVTVNRPDVRIRARKGYRVPLSPTAK